MPKPPAPPRPDADALRAARDRTVPDIIAPSLDVLFVGINPSLYSAAVRHHFARPGNRFWPVLHQAGFTPHRLAPHQERELLRHRCGITNVVARATARADELSKAEIHAGGRRLAAKVRRLKPRVVAVLGVGAYRIAFARPQAGIGRQPDALAGANVWVLPNPSGLNAHYQLADLVRLYRPLRTAV